MEKHEAPRWQNWSATVQARPQQIAQPSTIDELVKLLSTYRAQGRHVRVVGGGHSFTPLARSDDVLLSLDRMQGIEAIDKQTMTVTVLGGTRLKRLGDELFIHGLAQENLGDSAGQSIAGAISTGTHGTGVRFGSLSTQVVGLTLVSATGAVLECSAEQLPDLFKAAQVSLGMLGVIAQVKLRVVSARHMRLSTLPYEELSDCLRNLERHKREHSHFEFFWIPDAETVRLQFIDELEAYASGDNSRIDYSHRLYDMMPDDTPSLMGFRAMEYSIPAEYLSAVITEIEDGINRGRFVIHDPIVCRFVYADDIWLSPTYQREAAYVGVYEFLPRIVMARGYPEAEYFRHVEEIFRRYQGRPHWGKIHTQDAASLAALYPRWHDFRRVRAQLDPEGMFLNDYLRTLFDTDEPLPQEGDGFPLR